MKVKVRLFAIARDRAGCSELDLELDDGSNVGNLKRALVLESSALAPIIRSLLISVNREYAVDSALIPESAEIAVIPPVSGGVLVEVSTDD